MMAKGLVEQRSRESLPKRISAYDLVGGFSRVIRPYKKPACQGNLPKKIDTHGRLALCWDRSPLFSPPGEHENTCTARAKYPPHHANGSS